MTVPREPHVGALMTFLKYVTHKGERLDYSTNGLVEHGIKVQDT
jgi:hypothetical protein